MPGDTRMYPRFTAAEFARRHDAARAMMAREGLDALVVYGDSSLNRHNQADVHYLSGFLGNRDNYAAMTRAAGPVLFVQSHNHVPNALEISAIETRWGGDDSAVTVGEWVRDACPTTAVMGYVGDVPARAYLTWQRLLPGWSCADVTSAFRRLRLKKSPEEMDWLRRGVALTDAAVENLIRGARPGLREYELGALIEESALPGGGLPHLYYISSTPQDHPSACVPRQNLSHRIVERGDVITCEISISYWGYSGQAHRPIFVGVEPNPLYRRLCEVALDAYARCAAILRPGATVEDVLDAADVIHEAGFTVNDGFLHGFAIGLLPPSVGTRQTARRPHPPFAFEAGMCVVVQPNPVTHDGRAGVQIGNLFHITDTGAECLHRLPVQYFVTG